jgi:signal transduction histidine kinase
MTKTPILLLLFVSLLFAGALHGQQYGFQNYAFRNGLPNNVVKSIGQDNLGFLYFGTNSGLCVYDGSTLLPVNLPGAGDLQPVFRIKPLGPAQLWVNHTGNKHLLMVEKGNLHQTILTNKIDINNIYTDLGRDTILCTDAGLYKLRGTKTEAVTTNLTDKARIVHFLLPVGNNLLVGRKGFPVGLIDRQQLKKLDETEESISVTDMAAASDGDVWLGTDSRGFCRLDGKALAAGRIVFKALPPSIAFLANEDIFCLTTNPADGSLLIGTTHFGIVIYHRDGTSSMINRQNGLSANAVRCIFIDRDQNWWVGTNFGVDKLNNTDLIVYGRNNGIEAGNIHYTCPDATGRIWFFGREKLYYMDGDTARVVNYPAGVESIPLGVAVMPQKIWVSTPEHIFTIRTSGSRPTVTPARKVPETYHRMITWDDRTVILGGRHSLSLMHDEQIFPLSDTIEDVRSLMKDRFNRLWVGTFSDGIYRIALENKNNKYEARLLKRILDSTSSYNRFLTIMQSREGDVYAGTRFEGLYIFGITPDSVTRKKVLTTREGLSNNFITCLSQSADGSIWVGTNTGFNRIRPLGDNYRVSNVSKHYSFNNHISSMFTQNGFLWAATDVGGVKMTMHEEKRYDLDIYIKEITFPDSTISIYSHDTTLTFSPKRNSFSVSFTAPFYMNEQQTGYLYRLLHNGKGDWIRLHGNHSINFTSLESGDYVLELRPVSFADQTSKKIARLTFRIQTPFHRTGWFIGMVALLILLLAYAFYRYRIRGLKKLYEVRDHISRNLHDEIGATLSSINIYSDVARKKVADESEARSLLDRIYKGSSQVMESMNDIVWYVNPQHDSWDDIIVRMREFAIPVLEAREIDVRFEADEKLLTQKLSMEQRKNVYFIFKEAVNNIVKYSGTAEVDIHLFRYQQAIHLTIRDYGKGFDMQTRSSGNGLKNMRQRAADMKGDIRIESKPGEGTTIDLVVPLT